MNLCLLEVSINDVLREGFNSVFNSSYLVDWYSVPSYEHKEGLAKLETRAISFKALKHFCSTNLFLHHVIHPLGVSFAAELEAKIQLAKLSLSGLGHQWANTKPAITILNGIKYPRVVITEEEQALAFVVYFDYGIYHSWPLATPNEA